MGFRRGMPLVAASNALISGLKMSERSVVYRVTVLSTTPPVPWRRSRSKAPAGTGTCAWLTATPWTRM